MQAYCMKCRVKREMKDAKVITMKNGKPATKGSCPVCGTRMFRIGRLGGGNMGEARSARKRFTVIMKDDETPEEFHARGGISLEGDTPEEFIALGKTPEEREWRRKYVQRVTSPKGLARRYKEISSQPLGNIIGEMDPEIVPVCRELNTKGYETWASCAGHRLLDAGYTTRGYLAFKNVKRGEFTDRQKREIEEILSKYGIRNIEFEKGNWEDVACGEVRANFAGSGKAKANSEMDNGIPDTVVRQYQGSEISATLQAPTMRDLNKLVRGLQEYAAEHELVSIKILEKGKDPDGGYRAIIVAHNWNPIKWIKEKWGEVKGIWAQEVKKQEEARQERDAENALETRARQAERERKETEHRAKREQKEAERKAKRKRQEVEKEAKRQAKVAFLKRKAEVEKAKAQLVVVKAEGKTREEELKARRRIAKQRGEGSIRISRRGGGDTSFLASLGEATGAIVEGLLTPVAAVAKEGIHEAGAIRKAELAKPARVKTQIAPIKTPSPTRTLEGLTPIEVAGELKKMGLDASSLQELKGAEYWSDTVSEGDIKMIQRNAFLNRLPQRERMQVEFYLDYPQSKGMVKQRRRVMPIRRRRNGGRNGTGVQLSGVQLR